MRTRIALATATSVVFTGAGWLAGPSVPPVAAATLPARSVSPVGSPAAVVTASTRSAADLSFLNRFAIAPDDLVPPAPTTAVSPAAPPPPPPTDATSVWTSDWQCIRDFESNNRFNSPQAPSGAYGIVEETWQSFGQSGWPYEATADQQNAVALELYGLYGWGPWSSRYACGL